MKRFNVGKLTAVILGGIAGFSYYHYIGCASGSCPITCNPWISTMYGAVMGWLAIPLRRKEASTEQ